MDPFMTPRLESRPHGPLSGVVRGLLLTRHTATPAVPNPVHFRHPSPYLFARKLVMRMWQLLGVAAIPGTLAVGRTARRRYPVCPRDRPP
jgi:hypothetical protein